MIKNIAITFEDILLNEINKIIDDTKTEEQKMTDLKYKGLSVDEPIKAFYEILECADRDYRNEIDNEYMNIMLTEFCMLNLTEEQSYDLEYLSRRVDARPDDHVYSAEELETLYDVLSSFRYDLLKKYDISFPLFEH